MIEDLKGYWAYRVIDRLRLDDPWEAMRLAPVALRRVDGRLVPWVLGAFGSALRRVGHQRRALAVLHRARTNAEQLQDIRCQATIERLLTGVHSDLGKNLEGVEHGYKSYFLFLYLEDGAGQAESLISLAHCQYHLHDFEAAIRSNKSALRLLPAKDRNFRFSACLGNAYCYEELGDLVKADAWAEQAEQHTVGVSPALVASLLIQRGKLAMRRGLHHVAALRYQRAYDFYVDKGLYLYAAGVALELCEAFALSGRQDMARDTASETIDLMQHLSDSPVARDVVTVLTNHAATGRPITLKLLADLRTRLGSALSQLPGSG